MKHPLVNPIEEKEELITAFTGYDHRISATEGSYFDMENMTSDYYPVMSPRKPRNTVQLLSRIPECVTHYSDLGFVWVSSGNLYIDGVQKTTGGFGNLPQTVVRMGANLVFFPANKMYNTEDETLKSLGAEGYTYQCDKLSRYWAKADGTRIVISNLVPVPPTDGMYTARTEGGVKGVYQYSSYTGTWNAVETPCTILEYKGCYGSPFENIKEGDGIKLTVKTTWASDYQKENIFITDEGDGYISAILTVVKKIDSSTIAVNMDFKEDDTIYPPFVPTCTFPNPYTSYEAKVERIVPEMSYVIECQNRLWGCSKDGHEIYASKLGDPTNWQVFQGISTDSWAATVGSEGEFTGAINYQGTPVFFKKNVIGKVSISAVSGHAYRETVCQGIPYGYGGSLALINSMLYYRGKDYFYMYDGSFPVPMADVFGELPISDIDSSLALGNKYYVNMSKGLFVYDTVKGIWTREDNFKENIELLINDGFYVGFKGQNTVYISALIGGFSALEKKPLVDWFVESNNIGYLYTSKSHRSRINDKNYIKKIVIQAHLEQESHMSVYISYDSSDQWEFLLNVSGTTSNLIPIPIRPHRCNHFRYKIVGHGDVKIYSITKYYTEGSTS